jgi:hypothetical protein
VSCAVDIRYNLAATFLSFPVHLQVTRTSALGTISSLSIRNRFVRSATWEGLAAEEGSVTPRLLEMMTKLAQEELGLIVTSHAFIR